MVDKRPIGYEAGKTYVQLLAIFSFFTIAYSMFLRFSSILDSIPIEFFTVSLTFHY